jgi:putative membrane protein
MDTTLLVFGAAFAVLAGLLHFYIFTMESVTWTRPATWRRFGLESQEDAETTRSLAYNQGFYNAFLGAGAVVGSALLLFSDAQQAGYGVALFAVLSMLAAASVLIVSSPALARAAITQGTLPLISVVLLLLALVV